MTAGKPSTQENPLVKRSAQHIPAAVVAPHSVGSERQLAPLAELAVRRPVLLACSINATVTTGETHHSQS